MVPCVEIKTHLYVYANHVHDSRQKQATFT